MVNAKWGVAALVAGLAFGTPAWAQSSGSQMGTGGQRDPGSDTTRSTESGKGGSHGSSGQMGGSSSDTGATSGQSASSRGTGSSASGKSAPDKDLTEAAEKIHAANQSEIQMGQMAQQMAQSPDVKQYGQKLADDHQKNDEKLQTLAQTIGIQLTGKAFQDAQKDSQKAMKKLEGKQGAEFDKAFMSAMVSDHKKDVKDVEKAAKDARKKNQTEMASYLEATHTGLQGHLQEAERIEKQLKSGGSQASGARGAGTSGTGSSGMGGGTGGSSTGGAGSSGTGAGGSGGGTGGSSTGGSPGGGR